MSEPVATVALLVVAEHDIDPAAAFGSAAALSPRYYARIGRGPGAGAAAGSLDSVVVVEAAHAEEAIRQVMRRNPEIPLLVMSAGERLVHGADSQGPLRRSAQLGPGIVGSAGSERRVPSRILVAGRWVSHAPWFGAVRAHVRVPGSHRGALPDIAVERRPRDLSNVLSASTRSAVERPRAAGASGAPGILLAPVIASLRVYCGGAWRDGVRGLLLAALHGLGALVAVTRGSLAPDAFSARTLEKGSRS